MIEILPSTWMDLRGHGHMDWFVSAPLVYVWLLLGLIVIAILLISGLRWLRRARRAEASVRDDSSLAPGESGVRGVVERLPGADVAVRLEIQQQGEEHTDSGSWVHSWTERDRHLRVHPFLIRLGSGERVLIHPDQRVFLADALDGLIQVDRAARVRVAELTPGETVVATGWLDRVAPGAAAHGETWTLRPSGREPMILSTEPLGDRFLARARTRLRCAAIAAVLVMVPQLFLLGYHARTLFGHAEYGTVASQAEDGTVTLTFADGGQLAEGVDQQVGVGDRVAALRVAGVGWADSVGRRPTAHSTPVVVALVAATLSLFLLLILPSRWYEKPRVVDTGSGKLAGDAPAPDDAAAPSAFAAGAPAGYRDPAPPAVSLPTSGWPKPLVIGLALLGGLGGGGIGLWAYLTVTPQIEAVRAEGSAFLARVRAGDLDGAYATAASGFNPDDPAWQRHLPYVAASTGEDLHNVSIGFDNRACLGGSLEGPDHLQIVMRLIEEDGRWKVLDAANDEDDVEGCEDIFDVD